MPSYAGSHGRFATVGAGAAVSTATVFGRTLFLVAVAIIFLSLLNLFSSR